jgi:hypothetical protein
MRLYWLKIEQPSILPIGNGNVAAARREKDSIGPSSAQATRDRNLLLI